MYSGGRRDVSQGTNLKDRWDEEAEEAEEGKKWEHGIVSISWKCGRGSIEAEIDLVLSPWWMGPSSSWDSNTAIEKGDSCSCGWWITANKRSLNTVNEVTLSDELESSKQFNSFMDVLGWNCIVNMKMEDERPRNKSEEEEEDAEEDGEESMYSEIGKELESWGAEGGLVGELMAILARRDRVGSWRRHRNDGCPSSDSSSGLQTKARQSPLHIWRLSIE